MAVRLASRMSGIADDIDDMDNIDISTIDEGCIIYVIYAELTYQLVNGFFVIFEVANVITVSSSEPSNPKDNDIWFVIP